MVGFLRVLLLKNMKIFTTLLFILTSFISVAQIQFEKTLEATFAKAKTDNKIVFIDYFNAGCPVCQQVNPLLESEEVGDFYNRYFVSYKLDTSEESTQKEREWLIDKGLHIDGVPKFIFFDKNQEFIHFSGVRATTKRILEIGKDALNPNKKLSMKPVFYENGQRNIGLLYAYSSYALLFNDMELVHKIADELYEIFPKENLNNNTSYLILKNAVFTTNNGFFKHWINNLDKLTGFEKGYREGTEKEQIERIIALDLNNQDKVWTSKELAELRKYMELANYSDQMDMILWEKELKAFVNENKTTEANALFRAILSKNKTEYSSALYIINHFLKNATNKKNKSFAIAEIESILAQHQNPKTQEEKDFVQKLHAILR